jgi:hypothetical protein
MYHLIALDETLRTRLFVAQFVFGLRDNILLCCQITSSDKSVVVQLSPGREDALLWSWSADMIYSSKSTYRGFFAGRTRASTAAQICLSRAPYGCRFFAWIVSRDRCWTAHHLKRRGVPRPAACPLCDQEPELHHLLLGCVVARKVWAWALNH